MGSPDCRSSHQVARGPGRLITLDGADAALVSTVMYRALAYLTALAVPVLDMGALPSERLVPLLTKGFWVLGHGHALGSNSPRDVAASPAPDLAIVIDATGSRREAWRAIRPLLDQLMTRRP